MNCGRLAEAEGLQRGREITVFSVVWHLCYKNHCQYAVSSLV